VSNNSILDTSLKSELDSKFKSGKSKLKSSKLTESANTSFKHDNSSKCVLKNNLQKINNRSSSKLFKEQYNTQVRKQPEKTVLRINSLKESNQIKSESINNLKKINLKKNKVPNESRLVQTPKKNLVEKTKDNKIPQKSNQNNAIKSIKTPTSKGKPSVNKSISNSGINVVRGAIEDKEANAKKDIIKNTKVNSD